MLGVVSVNNKHLTTEEALWYCDLSWEFFLIIFHRRQWRAALPWKGNLCTKEIVPNTSVEVSALLWGILYHIVRMKQISSLSHSSTLLWEQKQSDNAAFCFLFFGDLQFVAKTLHCQVAEIMPVTSLPTFWEDRFLVHAPVH